MEIKSKGPVLRFSPWYSREAYVEHKGRKGWVVFNEKAVDTAGLVGALSLYAGLLCGGPTAAREPSSRPQAAVSPTRLPPTGPASKDSAACCC